MKKMCSRKVRAALIVCLYFISILTVYLLYYRYHAYVEPNTGFKFEVGNVTPFYWIFLLTSYLPIFVLSVLFDSKFSNNTFLACMFAVLTTVAMEISALFTQLDRNSSDIYLGTCLLRFCAGLLGIIVLLVINIAKKQKRTGH